MIWRWFEGIAIGGREAAAQREVDRTEFELVQARHALRAALSAYAAAVENQHIIERRRDSHASEVAP